MHDPYAPQAILVDHEIRFEGSDLVTPFIDANVQPASLDITLGHQIVEFTWGSVVLDPRNDNSDHIKVHEVGEEGIVLSPQTLYLAETVERFKFPHHLVGRVEGKSSLGRLGLSIHSTAGFIDPGFVGTVTLELSCLMPIRLRPGMLIGQVSFMRCAHPELPYGHEGRKSHYQGQNGPTPSRSHL